VHSARRALRTQRAQRILCPGVQRLLVLGHVGERVNLVILTTVLLAVRCALRTQRAQRILWAQHVLRQLHLGHVVERVNLVILTTVLIAVRRAVQLHFHMEQFP
jgi:hypothetical protein